MQRRGCGNRIMVGQRDLRGRFIAQFRFWYAADVPGIENEFACPTLRRKRTIATYEYIWPSPMASNAFLQCSIVGFLASLDQVTATTSNRAGVPNRRCLFM